MVPKLPCYWEMAALLLKGDVVIRLCPWRRYQRSGQKSFLFFLCPPCPLPTLLLLCFFLLPLNYRRHASFFCQTLPKWQGQHDLGRKPQKPLIKIKHSSIPMGHFRTFVTLRESCLAQLFKNRIHTNFYKHYNVMIILHMEIHALESVKEKDTLHLYKQGKWSEHEYQVYFL